MKKGDMLIKGGRLIDPSQKIDDLLDLLIIDGRVAKIGKKLDKDSVEIIDAKHKVVAPGFIDIHVHLREPGQEYKEDIESGTRAAARGGFTTIACMPNTVPVIDNSGIVDLISQRVEAVGAVNVLPIGAATRGMKGEELSNIGELVEVGVPAISDDGFPIQNSYVLRKVLEYTRMFGCRFISHPEDKNLSESGVMHEGYISTVLGLRGIPSAAEEVMVARDIIMSELTGGPVHLAHITTEGSLRLIREAKARSVNITAETAPHYFTLTDESLTAYDANFKMNPPLRSARDLAAIKEALKDGTLDCIATDHAPHRQNEKLVEFNYAPFGVVGLETAVSVSLDALYHSGTLSLSALIELFTTRPAQILGLEAGTLKKGAPADVTIIDLDREITVQSTEFLSKSANTPFEGRKFKGAPSAAIVSGVCAHTEEN